MRFLSDPVLKLLGWSTGAFAAAQGIRLVNNVLLARILAPELFGIMLIVNTLRTGIELTSDVGIGQNIISNKDGAQPSFYSTGWTIQILRGVFLCLVFAAASPIIASFYKHPSISTVFLASSLIFLFSGFNSMGPALLQKRLELKRISIFEVSIAALSLVVHVGFALLSPTIWALVCAGIFTSAAAAAGTYLLVPGLRHQFMIDKSAALQILAFGKWVFLSSIVYFLAMNFDKLYLGKSVGFALLGIYGIARSLSEILSLLVGRFGNMIIFPMVAKSTQSRIGLRNSVASKRPLFLFAAAVGVSLFISVSDLMIGLLYDDRYIAAASMLPVLSAGVWFAILCTVNESVLLGIGHPAYGAQANAIKLAWLLVGLPIAVASYGIAGAVCVIAAADVVRYLSLWHSQRREHLAFASQDLLITISMVGMVGVWRTLLFAVGATPSLNTLWSLPGL